MCFYVSKDTNGSHISIRNDILQSFRFLSFIPQPLKLDAAMYNLISTMISNSSVLLPADTPDYISIGCSTSSLESSCSSSLTKILTTVKSYNFDALQKFYWSKPQSLLANNNTPLSVVEQDRHNLWGGIQSVLEPNSLFTTNNSDSCDFSSLTSSEMTTTVEISIKNYLKNSNTALVGNCLGYLVAVAAVDQGSSSVVLSKRYY